MRHKLQITQIKSDDSFFIGNETINFEIDSDTAISLIKLYGMKTINNDESKHTWEINFVKVKEVAV